MGNEKILSCSIDNELVEKFELALLLNKEDSNEVLSKLIIQYISDSFSKAAKSVSSQQTIKTNYLIEEDNNYAKANRKIPTWARKPQQNNHKIIKAFFELKEELEFVTVEALSGRCNDYENYPNTFVSDFRGNFAQMKTDASNSHGKVFIVKNDIVEIWDEIREVLMENKRYFTSNIIGGSEMNKITYEMVEIAYNVAKRVHSGELTRSEGKFEISNISGMSIGSAQDYITDFLAMMSGSEYHRTMSNYGTSYFLKNIRKDFGEEAFLLALGATEKHIKYYNSLGYGQLTAKENIVKELRESI